MDFFDPDYHSQSQGALYQHRWKAIQEAMAELNIEAFEGEVVWGKEIRDLLIPLRQQVGELSMSIEMYLKNLRKPVGREPDPKIQEALDKTIYDFQDLADIENKNPFSAKTTKIISDIENYLRPRIKL